MDMHWAKNILLFIGYMEKKCGKHQYQLLGAKPKLSSYWGVKNTEIKKGRVTLHTHKYSIDGCLFLKFWSCVQRKYWGCHHTSAESKHVFNSGKDY